VKAVLQAILKPKNVYLAEGKAKQGQSRLSVKPRNIQPPTTAISAEVLETKATIFRSP